MSVFLIGLYSNYKKPFCKAIGWDFGKREDKENRVICHQTFLFKLTFCVRACRELGAEELLDFAALRSKKKR
jgi:hypothetical protein